MIGGHLKPCRSEPYRDLQPILLLQPRWVSLFPFFPSSLLPLNHLRRKNSTILLPGSANYPRPTHLFQRSVEPYFALLPATIASFVRDFKNHTVASFWEPTPLSAVDGADRCVVRLWNSHLFGMNTVVEKFQRRHELTKIFPCKA